MKFTTTLKSLAGAVALTAIAGMATAATYANINTQGDWIYDYESSGVSAVLTGDAAGVLTLGNLDTSVVRDYTFNYSFTATNGFSGQSSTFSGSIHLGSNSINGLYAAFLPLSSNPIADLIMTYANPLWTAGTGTGSVDYVATLGDTSTQYMMQQLGWAPPTPKSDGYGTYIASGELIAPVPLPAAAPLLLLGIGGLVAFGRKRRRKAA